MSTNSIKTTPLYGIRSFSKEPFAVDAPDGDSDAEIVEEMHDIDEILAEAALDESPEAVEAKLKQEQGRPFAVDAPDGEPEYMVQEEMEEVNHIIDDAAVLEDKEKIEAEHELKQEVKKYHAKDPEHDW